MIDYPGNICCVVFTCGCNFTCPFCHNGELIRMVPDNEDTGYDLESVLAFLEKRKGLLDGVSITGGEPTLQEGLVDFCKRVKSMGYRVKLDTNGSRPEVVRRLTDQSLVDYIAMDIKAVPARYPEFVSGFDRDAFLESIGILLSHPVDYEFRTTCAKPFVSEEMIGEVAQLIRGARLYALQNCRYDTVLNPGFYKGVDPFTVEELEHFRSIASETVTTCIIR